MTNIDLALPAVKIARQWLGTPYHHQASVKGVGCDCLGLIRGIWRELYGYEAEAVPAYSRDWGDVSGDEALLAAGNRHLISKPIAELTPGDVFALRWKRGKCAKHVGILSGPDRFIHAYEKRGVVEVSLNRQWRLMIVGVWRFRNEVS